MAKIIFVCFLTLVTVVRSLFTEHTARYEPNWPSLDARPIPEWFDDAKIGVFIHWGVFSVPSFESEWFWWRWQGLKKKSVVNFMEENYRPDFTYGDFASMFTAEFYDPQKWADIIEASGAKYVVLTSKHHEGFTNWPSTRSFNWNSKDVGPKRDLVGDLAFAIRNKTNMHFGLYYSLFEWFHPLYLIDSKNDFKTQYFVESKSLPELHELVNSYKPEIVWGDGDWFANDTYWNSTEFIAWLYNDSPVKDTVLVNDRWGIGTRCRHGGYYTCHDGYNPGKLQKHKWENAMIMMKKSWGYRREAPLSDYRTAEEIVHILVETVSCGGNLLMNIGPTHDGRIMPIFEERLREIGSWLKVNGEAIYSTIPWIHQNDTVTPGVWYTSSKNSPEPVVYAIVLKWPSGGTLLLGSPKPSAQTTVNLLGYPNPFQWIDKSPRGIEIQMQAIPFTSMPCHWAWVFKLTALN